MALKIARATGVRYLDTLSVLDRFMDEIMRELAAGNDVEMRGFGTFALRTRKSRVQRTVFTGGKPVMSPERRFVKFRMGNLLRAAVTDGKKVTLMGVKRCRKSANPKS